MGLGLGIGLGVGSGLGLGLGILEHRLGSGSDLQEGDLGPHVGIDREAEGLRVAREHAGGRDAEGGEEGDLAGEM